MTACDSTPIPSGILDRNLGLVRRVIRSHFGTLVAMEASVDEDDLIQAAYIGLVNAHRTYDPAGGSAWLTWAYICVRRQISNELKAALGGNYRRCVANGDLYTTPWSIDFPFLPGGKSDDEPITLAETLTDPPDDGPNEARWAMVDDLLGRLSEGDQVVVTNPSRVAAEILGIKQTSVHRRRARAYDKLRSAVAS